MPLCAAFFPPALQPLAFVAAVLDHGRGLTNITAVAMLKPNKYSPIMVHAWIIQGQFLWESQKTLAPGIEPGSPA